MSDPATQTPLPCPRGDTPALDGLLRHDLVNELLAARLRCVVLARLCQDEPARGHVEALAACVARAAALAKSIRAE